MNKNYTHTVIQSVAKNLGNTRLMYPRSFTPFRMTMLAAAMALSFSACQNEEPLDAPVAKDVLALMPAETPVGVQAELKAESRAAEADANTAYDFTLSIPGGSSSTSFTGSATVATLGNDFPTLQLKDFNLEEGAGRCVSRWTILEAKKDGYETLTGVARLTADANGLPTLSYNLLHTGAKVTVVLTDGTTSFSTIDGIGATLAVKNSKGVWKYGNATLASHLDNVKELNNDPTADDANMKLAIEADETALASIAMTATSDKKFTTVVPATPDGATLADDEVLTITVNTDPDEVDGPLITGTYTLKLKDVKVTENGQQKPLTAMKSGEHLTLTVTLAHKMKVSATATIGDWDQVSADVDLNDDAAKMQPYTYDAESDTYTVYLAEGLYAWAEAVRTAMNAGAETHPNLILAEDITLPAKTEEGQGTDITVSEGMPSGSNWTPVGKYFGNIDGRGHTISRLRINSDATNTGFLSVLGMGSVVKNLTFADAVVYSTKTYTAVVVGYSDGNSWNGNRAIVDNCHVTSNSSVKSKDTEVGGIVGNNFGLIMGCTNAAAVESTYSDNYPSLNVGGIVGCNTMGTIIACANTGAVTNPKGNRNVAGKTYACWSTAARDLESNYGGGDNGKRTACYIIEGNTITEVDNSIAVATISEAVTVMNTAISDYNASAAEGKKCPYTWELPQGESTPKLKKSNL